MVLLLSLILEVEVGTGTEAILLLRESLSEPTFVPLLDIDCCDADNIIELDEEAVDTTAEIVDVRFPPTDAELVPVLPVVIPDPSPGPLPGPTVPLPPAVGLLTVYFEFPNNCLPRPGTPLPPMRPLPAAIPGPWPGPKKEEEKHIHEGRETYT